MAYYSDDEEQQVGGSGGETGAGAISKPGSGIVSGGTTGGQGGAAPAAEAKQSTPGNTASPFVGIKEYLNANKQQSGKLGGQVGGFVGGRVDQANEALKGAEQNFGQQVDQNTVKLDQNLLNEIKADPTKVAADQAKLQQAKNMQKAYSGPTDFQSNQAYQAAAPTVQKAQTTAENLGTAQGQKQILTDQQLETRGGKVNRGAATLDQALLQASPEAKEALKPTQEKAAGLKNTIDQTIQNAMNKVSGAQQQSAASNKQLNDLYNQQFQSQQQALSQRAAQANQEVQQYNEALKGRLYNGDVTDQDLAYLGINRNDFNSLRGDFEQYVPNEGLGGYTNPGLTQFQNYMQANAPGATAQNVASAEDYARAQALSQLAGFGGDYLSNPNMANTFNRDSVNFDLAGARNYINPIKTAEEKRRALANYKMPVPDVGGAVNEAAQGPLAPIGNAISSAGRSIGISDERLKKDKKPFDAKQFLEAIGGRA
jgi:Txe/YoeB family toxin of Txe-Axe toxin-antitoxin module